MDIRLIVARKKACRKVAEKFLKLYHTELIKESYPKNKTALENYHYELIGYNAQLQLLGEMNFRKAYHKYLKRLHHTQPFLSRKCDITTEVLNRTRECKTYLEYVRMERIYNGVYKKA